MFSPQELYLTLLVVDENDVFFQAFVNSVLFCTAFHFAFRAMFKRYFGPSYYQMDKSSRIFLSEKIISTLHGLLVGLLSLKMVWYDGVYEDDVLHAWHPLLSWLFGISSGYEVYDMMTMYLQHDQGILMWIHHTVILIGYQISMRTHTLSFLAALLLVTELTCLPSNLHWYLKVLSRKDTRAFHFNQGLRLWSFVLLRLFIVPYAFYRLYLQREEFVDNPLWFQLATVLITGTLGFMNVHWTYTMWVLYRKREKLWQTRLRHRKMNENESECKGNSKDHLSKNLNEGNAPSDDLTARKKKR
eukprot:TRINITY_DN14949_c0_g1_i1.p1 TRINITY_DN14949_c0_g1~~TRINITY_DN14949_c0_g1_i1.p1  ORF type:complete len:301 (-),score=60.75 TRINITY_DN14949_c0_g1_i1:101-1003(-)